MGESKQSSSAVSFFIDNFDFSIDNFIYPCPPPSQSLTLLPKSQILSISSPKPCVKNLLDIQWGKSKQSSLADSMSKWKESIFANRNSSPSPSPPQNPFLQIQSKWKELENGFECWVSKQPLYIEAAVITARGAVQAALLGAIMTTGRQALFPSSPPVVPPVRLRSDLMFGVVDAGLNTVSKRLRRTEDGDLQIVARVVDEFRHGIMFFLAVDECRDPVYSLENSFISGLSSIFIQESYYFVVREIKAGVVNPEEEKAYLKTKSMLKKLGMDKYQWNFKSGMLDDYTLPLLTNSALKEVNIPPGPRLRILDYIQRHPEIDQR